MEIIINNKIFLPYLYRFVLSYLYIQYYTANGNIYCSNSTREYHRHYYIPEEILIRCGDDIKYKNKTKVSNVKYHFVFKQTQEYNKHNYNYTYGQYIEDILKKLYDYIKDNGIDNIIFHSKDEVSINIKENIELTFNPHVDNIPHILPVKNEIKLDKVFTLKKFATAVFNTKEYKFDYRLNFESVNKIDYKNNIITLNRTKKML